MPAFSRVPCRPKKSRKSPMNLKRWPLNSLFVIFSAAFFDLAEGHGRLMEPVSRSSMWRKGFNNPADYNDNQGYCGGYSVQWIQNKGACGVCGDPFGEFPRDHEAPGGRFANGIITREYKSGQVIDVEVDVTANHQGSFTFKLCANNNIDRDSDQSCFDRHVLKVYPEMTETFELPSPLSQTFKIKLKLPDQLTCSQCVLQWTYNTANSWGTCADGSGAIGCGPQETFRACSDIKIAQNVPEFHPDNTRTTLTALAHNEIIHFNDVPEHDVSRGKQKVSFFWMNSGAGSSSEQPVKKKKNKKKNKHKSKIADRPKLKKTSKNGKTEHTQHSAKSPSAWPNQAPRNNQIATTAKPKATKNQQQPYGYFSFSLGDSEDVNVILGLPGASEPHFDQGKLKEFADVVKANEWP